MQIETHPSCDGFYLEHILCLANEMGWIKYQPKFHLHSTNPVLDNGVFQSLDNGYASDGVAPMQDSFKKQEVHQGFFTSLALWYLSDVFELDSVSVSVSV